LQHTRRTARSARAASPWTSVSRRRASGRTPPCWDGSAGLSGSILPAMKIDQLTRNKHLVESIIQELFTKGDLTAIDRYLSPDFVNHDPPLPGAPEDAEGMRQAAEV